MQAPRISRMQAADLESALGFTERVAAERRWIGTEPGFDRDRYRSRWRDKLDDPSAALLVAKCGQDVVGFADVYPHSEHGLVLGMFVDERFRGQGIGTALLDRLLDWARQKNVPRLSLHVFPHNSRAIALYKRAGFTERLRIAGFAKRRSGEVWDAILMLKEL
jgi:[ribosomal protein S18]-alanine N-acetyltransferase